MQEQILPSRMVRFGTFQATWKCRTKCEGEYWPSYPWVEDDLGILDWVRARHSDTGTDPNLKLIPRKEGTDWVSVSRLDLYNGWYRSLHDYIWRDITKPEDILPGIGGIASRFGNLVGDEYIAGLWKQDIHRGLLWMPLPQGQRCRAPSWSWASIDMNAI